MVLLNTRRWDLDYKRTIGGTRPRTFWTDPAYLNRRFQKSSLFSVLHLFSQNKHLETEKAISFRRRSNSKHDINYRSWIQWLRVCCRPNFVVWFFGFNILPSANAMTLSISFLILSERPHFWTMFMQVTMPFTFDNIIIFDPMWRSRAYPILTRLLFRIGISMKKKEKLIASRSEALWLENLLPDWVVASASCYSLSLSIRGLWTKRSSFWYWTR